MMCHPVLTARKFLMQAHKINNFPFFTFRASRTSSTTTRARRTGWTRGCRGCRRSGPRSATTTSCRSGGSASTTRTTAPTTSTTSTGGRSTRTRSSWPRRPSMQAEGPTRGSAPVQVRTSVGARGMVSAIIVLSLSSQVNSSQIRGEMGNEFITH